MKTLRSRFARPSLERLEGRIVPATTAYNIVTRTLTVNAAEAEPLTVSQIPNMPTGYIAVTKAVVGDVFHSDSPNGRVVRNLVVHFDKVNNGSLTLDATTRLGGNLTVFGAKVATTVQSAGTIGAGVAFTPTGAGKDTWSFEGTTQVGKGVNLKLGGGLDTVQLKGGLIGGDLTVLGEAGNDAVEVVQDGDLRVNGAVKIDLGDGVNTLVARGAHLLDVGKDFTYQGNAGADAITLRSLDASTFDAALQVGGNASFAVDRTPVAGAGNTLDFNQVTVGGKLSITGGGAADTVHFSGPITVGGNFDVNLLNGANSFDPNVPGTSQNRIGGSFKYTGGAGQDQVYLDGTTVGAGVNVSLGNSEATQAIPNPDQFFRAGTYAADTIYGSLKVKAEVNGKDTIILHRLYVGNGVTIDAGGGDDLVRIDDTDIAGFVQVNLGAGNDTLGIEAIPFDAGGNLPGTTTFGGLLHISGGLGNDTVNLGRLDPSGELQFGDTVTLDGGDGTDTLTVGPNAHFLVTGNSSTFENGPAVP